MENQKWKQIRELYQEIKAKILLYTNKNKLVDLAMK